MSQYNEEKDIYFVYEKEINLYDSDEAGITCQKVLINGKEMGIHEFKRNCKKQEKTKGHSWLRRHGFIPYND